MNNKIIKTISLIFVFNLHSKITIKSDGSGPKVLFAELPKGRKETLIENLALKEASLKDGENEINPLSVVMTRIGSVVVSFSQNKVSQRRLRSQRGLADLTDIIVENQSGAELFSQKLTQKGVRRGFKIPFAGYSMEIKNARLTIRESQDK